MHLVILFITGFLTCYVNGAVNVFVDPPSVATAAKSSVYVSCDVMPRTGIRVTWKKDDKDVPLYPIGGSAKDMAYVFANNNTLYIGSVKRRHTGEYTCVAFSQTTGETVFKSTTITIQYMQQLEEIDPVLVYKGTKAEVHCIEPLAKPFATVSWMFNGAPIPASDRVKQDGWTLEINSVTLNEQGSYTCVATNIAKTRMVNASLQVIIPGDVTVTPKRDEIKEGEQTSFTCKSLAIPPLPTTWKRVTKVCAQQCNQVDTVIDAENIERITIKDGKLSIKDALPSDKGKYKCEASLGSTFDATAVDLNVIEKIKEDQISHQRYQAKDVRAKNVTISCRFQGDGLYKVSWSRVNSSTPSLPSKMKANTTVLTIPDLQFEDMGLYRCTAVGVFNTARADVQLDVYESPIFNTKPSNVSAPEGESVWINCNGDGVPKPQVSYHKDGQTGLNETHFVQLANNTLYIKQVQKENEGVYYCWLTQKHGIVSETFRIVVKDPLPPPKPSTSPMGRTVGIAVGCAGVYILLVIGLMIYCRARRARLLKQGIITEVEDGDMKDPLFANEEIPLQNCKSPDEWQYPRDQLSNVITLGYGKMGRVFKANAKEIKEGVPETLVAVKEFEGSGEPLKQEFDLEMEMFVQLNHENVVKLLGVSSLTTPYFLIIEYGAMGDLKQHLMNSTRTFTSQEYLNMAYSIASGMEYLVRLRYIHRDLSTRNCIVMNENNIKISFLSLCEDVYKDDYYLLNNIPVPLRWLSPEAILNEAYSEKSDVWSFGVTIWEIFSAGKRPYVEYDNEKVRDGVCKDLRLPALAGCPPVVYDIMKRCWNHIAGERPSFKDIVLLINEINLEKE